MYSIHQNKGENMSPQEENEKLRLLVSGYKSYIEMLGEEIKSLFGIAYSHGWTSTRVEEGKNMREFIELLEKELKL
jgi:hypothetical protein